MNASLRSMQGGNHIRREMSAGENFNSLLENGDQLIIIENIEISNVALVAFLEWISKKYAACRFIFMVRAPIAGPPPAEVAVNVGVPYRTLYAGVFEREHVRQFVIKWGLPAQSDVEQLINSTIDRFSQLNVPICAVNLTFYMYVLEQTQDFSPINLFVLLEMFIEALLEKNDPKMIFRSEFDFVNKVDCLAHVSVIMAKRDEYFVPRDELLAATEQYFQDLEVDQNASEVLDYFFKTQMLVDNQGVVSFKYTIFFSFFLAKAMATSEDVRNFIVSDENCTRYLTELDIYFGSVRNDIKSLEKLAQFHAEADSELDACLAEAGISVDNTFVEQLALRRNPETDSVFASIARRVANGGAVPEERDQHLQSPTEQRIGLLQEMKRPKFRSAIARWVLTLRAYSVAVKNMELISGQEKRKHLGVLLKSWSKATAAGLVLVEGLAKDGSVTIGNVTIYVKDDVQKLMKGKTMRLFYLMVPHAIADYMRRDLGSPKLAKLLSDRAVVGDNLLPEFMQKILGSDLRIPGYLDGIESLAKRLKGSPYLREALLWHLWRVYFRRKLKKQEEEKFTGVVADLYMDIKGTHGSKRRGERAKILEQAHKEKLQNDRSDK